MQLAIPDIQQCFQPGFDFESMAEQVWQYQLAENPIVRTFCDHLGSTQMQFLPISFFKDFACKTGNSWEAEVLFESSGTTGTATSRHHVRDAGLYRKSLLEGFRHFYGDQDYTIFALLPNYLERGNSSLVFMVNEWVDAFGEPGSGFYLYNHDELYAELTKASASKRKILVIGVSFALLDFAEKYSLKLPKDAIVMETGGMKGRREEITREQLHKSLQDGFGVANVHSEYGMTELLSQAYAMEPGRFHCPPWMRVVITDLWLPGHELAVGKTGRINIIDLMNVHSLAFMRTDDMGKMHPDGTFEVLGRADVADMRGCNLMYETA